MNQNPILTKGYRNVFCPYYSNCLNYAAKNHWGYWACIDCQHKSKYILKDVQLPPDSAYPYYSLSPSLYEEKENFSI
jgi:hypothetical protein